MDGRFCYGGLPGSLETKTGLYQLQWGVSPRVFAIGEAHQKQGFTPWRKALLVA
jgi:hypothetical protein